MLYLKIAVAGTGYVGLSLAVLLSLKNEVIALDIIKDKVDKINNRISPIVDDVIEKYLKISKIVLTNRKSSGIIIPSKENNKHFIRNSFNS